MLARVVMRSLVKTDGLMVLVYLAGALLLGYVLATVTAAVAGEMSAALDRYRHRRALRLILAGIQPRRSRGSW